MDRDHLVRLGVCVRVHTTAGYAHLTDGYLVAAAERVGSTTSNSMQNGSIDNLE